MSKPSGRHARSTSQGNTQKSKTTGARRRIMLWLTFMICFTGWAGYTFYSQSVQMADKSAKLEQATKVNAEAQKEKTELSNEVERLQDPEYIGQLARKKYGMFLPGETPIYPVDE
ncbi:septum formation initiator family protein [Paenibacillus urinalis]|uniref:Septum formation initiator family protein n=1 Tax=Paenibacillus urinalis TaxID=521520 RepID=A0ABY7XCL8_9BACL|nr:septum formation initiator family protein [Paenibacillus urinalis]WDH98806.1 septum formation initiator family protein [Paenibacillus urinalis]WDI02501.1 septum formation initiator family protein [Paenibacillus urinalis]